MKKYNIFWFIIDSVRTFRTGLDDRDRLDIMDDLAKESIEFTNCVTSSPSSLLSAGAIFTGLPGIFVARHFNDWKFKNSEIDTIQTLVNKYEYNSFPVLDNRELRERLQFLLPPLKAKDLPKGFKLSDYAWHNDQISEVFKHILNKYKDEISCYTLWYDCRRDPSTSKQVKNAINEIKKLGLYENSIIIMHSDHGYPDPRTKLNEEYFRNIGHDMVLTDDNIKVPFLLKYPDSPKDIKINHQIGLVDVIPTIFDLLDLSYFQTTTKYQGSSLLPIINGKEKKDERMRRTDTRLPMDVNRMSALRNNEYKYIYLFGDSTEIIFNLKNDPNETTNILDRIPQQILENFRKLIEDYEQELYLFHKKDLESNIKLLSKEIIRRCPNKNDIKIMIVTNSEPSLIQILIDLLSKEDNFVLEVLSANKRNNQLRGISNIKIVKALAQKNLTNIYINSYDTVIYLTENSKRVFLKQEQYTAIKNIKTKNIFLLNFNFEIFNYFYSKYFNTAFFKLFFDWEIKGYFYKQEPLYFLRDVGFFILGFFQRFILLIKRKEDGFDLNASKEAFEFRNYHILTNDNNKLKEMDKDQLKYEIDRIKTRE